MGKEIEKKERERLAYKRTGKIIRSLCIFSIVIGAGLIIFGLIDFYFNLTIMSSSSELVVFVILGIFFIAQSIYFIRKHL